MVSAQKELITVIMPVLNGARFIGDALASIRAQQYQPLELLVIDGGSTDETKEIVRAFQEARCVPQYGQGVADAYNTGLQLARGTWIAFLEHDDCWKPDKLAKQFAFMRNRPELMFTQTHAEIFLEPGRSVPAGYRDNLLTVPQSGSILSTFLGRAEVFQKVGSFNGTFRCAGDVDWFARAKDLAVPSAILPDVLLRKRMHGQNLSATYQGNNAELLRALHASISRQRHRARTTP